MKSGFLLDVVVGQGSTIFELFTGKDKSLLVWWDTFLVLDLCFYIFDGIGCFNFQCNGLSSKSLDKDLHTTTKSEYQMQGRFLLDVIIRKGSSIFELFTGKDETLLIWWDTFLVLDFSFNIFDGVGCFNFECNCFTS